MYYLPQNLGVTLESGGRVPGKRSGAWVFRDTRTPVSVVFDNLEVGATIHEIMEWFHLSREQVIAVIEFAARSLDAPPPFQQPASMADAPTLRYRYACSASSRSHRPLGGGSYRTRMTSPSSKLHACSQREFSEVAFALEAIQRVHDSALAGILNGDQTPADLADRISEALRTLPRRALGVIGGSIRSAPSESASRTCAAAGKRFQYCIACNTATRNKQSPTHSSRGKSIRAAVHATCSAQGASRFASKTSQYFFGSTYQLPPNGLRSAWLSSQATASGSLNAGSFPLARLAASHRFVR
jgi:uncharacterized protein (DUF433 family)